MNIDEYIKLKSIPYTDFYSSITINDVIPQFDWDNSNDIAKYQTTGNKWMLY